MKAKSSIAKGKELEKFIVERLKMSGLDCRATRTPGSGNGLSKGDITNDLNLCIECKNCKNFSREWFKQVKRESLGVQIPIVVWHTNGVPLDDSVAIISWNYLEELLLKAKEPAMKNPDRQTAWKIQRLIQAAKDVQKELEQ
jgi:hypothetical protein